jgi:hypothetical protein
MVVGIGLWSPSSSAAIEVGVDIDVLFPLSGNRAILKNGCRRTGGLTGTALNTLVRIDIKMFDFLKPSFIWCWMDTVHRANIHTGCILRSDTRLGNYIGHGLKILLNHFARLSIRACEHIISFSQCTKHCHFIVGWRGSHSGDAYHRYPIARA